jgi:3-hydroxyacyl-[acyl-carrier-protein] dehydratase
MTDTPIHNYIPQRPPFVMIDELVETGESKTVTSFQVRDRHLFVCDGLFTEPGLIENMAQTAAAGTGSIAYHEGKPAPVGFIGALKGLKISSLPAVGDVIKTEVSVLYTIGNAHIAQAMVFCKGAEIASCEFKIFLQE